MISEAVSPRNVLGKRIKLTPEGTDPIGSQITAPMRRTNENNLLHPRVCFEDHCPFNQVVRRQRGIESIRTKPEEYSEASDATRCYLGRHRQCSHAMVAQSVSRLDQSAQRSNQIWKSLVVPANRRKKRSLPL
jgi:hypothetical protein